MHAVFARAETIKQPKVGERARHYHHPHTSRALRFFLSRPGRTKRFRFQRCTRARPCDNKQLASHRSLEETASKQQQQQMATVLCACVVLPIRPLLGVAAR